MRLYIFFMLFFCTSLVKLDAQCYGQLDNLVEISNPSRNRVFIQFGTLSSYGANGLEFYSENDIQLLKLGFARAVWAAGKDTNGNIRVCANTYPSGTSSSYSSGPIISNTEFEDYCNFYTRVWSVSRQDVLSLREAYQNNNIDINNIPADILEWPAKNNPWLDEFAPMEEVAPFYDVNSDGIYDPTVGDLPIALEENSEFIPHQFAFSVYNDLGFRAGFNRDPINIEFHQLDYVVNCISEKESDKAVFTRIKYIYKGSDTIEDFKLGIWSDEDLGCNSNDQVGCDTTLNTVYVYNREGDDNISSDYCVEPGQITGKKGIVRSMVLLNQDLQGFIKYSRQGLGNVPQAMIDPSQSHHYYNYLSGRYLDGEPISYGGNGYDPGNIDTVKHVYVDIPTMPNGWSMEEQDFVLEDQRTVSTIISENLTPGQIGVIDYADHILYDDREIGLDVFNEWEDHILTLKDEFEEFKAGGLDCEVTSTEEAKNSSVLRLRLYPNPSNENLHVEIEEATTGSLRIYNTLGLLIHSEALESQRRRAIDISFLSSGSYILRLESVDGEVIDQPFIKVSE